MQKEKFRRLIWEYYDKNRRDMPWRFPEEDGSFDPYKIMVTEIMLQQTQVSRVVPKYQEFLMHFPTVATLAEAELGEVLKTWSGLGYNRRAKYLQEAAKAVQQEFGGEFPTTLEQLVTLPGVGKNTAGAILVYGFNEPVVFIETNIRSVYLHHFFADKTEISDAELLPIIEATLDTENPREWYWALMDYGSYLKSQHQNPSRRSRHYTTQSKFSGSKRQLRGWVLKQLAKQSYTKHALMQLTEDDRLEVVLDDLLKEGLIRFSANKYML
jgi:A/G-specific adenine glycosylase